MSAIARVSPHRKARRRTAAERKRASPERYCSENRCYRAPLHLARCGSHATAYLDGLWRDRVRARGSCECCGATEAIQAAHGFSRRYRGTRWVILNGFALCNGCHVHFTHSPLEFDDWIRAEWGETVYEELRHRALAGKFDYEEALKELTSGTEV